VAAARGLSRAALDAALAAWASPRRVEPADGVLLPELQDKPRGLPDLTRSLEAAGASAAEIRAALGRLVTAGLVELVGPPSREAAEPVPPSLPPRWART
jgi:hypothetical protein